jgi:hypothetical protein
MIDRDWLSGVSATRPPPVGSRIGRENGVRGMRLSPGKPGGWHNHIAKLDSTGIRTVWNDLEATRAGIACRASNELWKHAFLDWLPAQFEAG